MNQQFANNPAYVEYEGLLRSLHDLVANGNNDTPEAEVIHDRMDILEPQLSRHEIDRLNGLSSDLYMLQGQEVLTSSEMTPAQIEQALKLAFHRNNWEQLLVILRMKPRVMPVDEVASLRGKCYEQLNHMRVSVWFYEYATQLAPGNYEYLLQLLWALDTVFQSTRTLPLNEATPILRDILALADGLLQKCADLVDAAQANSLTLPTLVMKALCYDFLCSPKDARRCYNQAIEINPNDGNLWALRGVLDYKADPGSASIPDFEQAIALNTSAISPYLFVARRLLDQREYHRSLLVCEQAISLTNRSTTLARLFSWSAIARYELGESADIVRRLFEQARSLDPFNEAIYQNYIVFEQRLTTRQNNNTLSWRSVDLVAQDMDPNLVAA